MQATESCLCMFLISWPPFWVQALGAVISGIVGWTSVSYDWSMVFKANINQS